MKTRKAEEKDLEQIVTILQQVSKLHYETRRDIFKEKTKEETEEYAKEILNNKDLNIIVAVDEKSKLCGLVIFKIKEVKNHVNLKDSKSVWVDELGVDENYRKNGIGKLLMKEVENKAKELGCDSIGLNCWEFNENAIKFYEKIGMKTQRRVFEKKID